MDQLAVHPLSRTQINALLQDIPQAILLSGPFGVGTATVARAIATQVTSHSTAVRLVEPDEKGTITIASVRELYVQSRSKSNQKQVFIIDNAEAMGIDAQNSLLKLLEEPNSTTHFILTTHAPSALLPTILSRLQQISLQPVGKQKSRELLSSYGVTASGDQTQLMFIGQGLPAELYRLSHDLKYRDQKIIQATQAKNLLSGTRYQQTAAVAMLANQPRDTVLSILDLTTRMLGMQLSRSQNDDLLKKLSVFMGASERIAQNGHIRTQLLHAVLA